MNRLKVIYIDDDSDVLETICPILSEKFEVYGFTDIADCLRFTMLEKDIDLIVADYNFKKQKENGIDYAKMIRESLKSPPPILIFTGDININLNSLGDLTNASIISKGASPETLLKKCEQVIRHSLTQRMIKAKADED